MVARLLPPEGPAVDVVSRQVRISVATLERWRAEALGRPRAKTKFVMRIPSIGYRIPQQAPRPLPLRVPPRRRRWDAPDRD